ncbi:MAG TPA: HD domain-containing phosphohydrolase [Aldersonia sp.]
MLQVRVVEVLAAISLTTDIAGGMAFEKGLRTCLVANEFGRRLALTPREQTVVFQTALLRSIGCTSFSSENADYFDDDIAFQTTLKDLDPGDPEVFAQQLAQFGSWTSREQQPVLAQRFLDLVPTEGVRATRSACEVGHGLADRLSLADGTAHALDYVYERFDGRGMPGTAHGTQIPLAARIVHVCERAVIVHGRTDRATVRTELERRAGGQLDPGLVAQFASIADDLLDRLELCDPFAAVVSAEPGTALVVGPDGLRTLAEGLAMIADLKGRYLIGHSQHVAAIVRRAAHGSGWPPDEVDFVEIAGLLHDIGRVGVPSSVWDRPAPLSAPDEERARMHPYWTARVLRRCPTLCRYADVAANHHECLDGSGFPRGVGGGELDRHSRLLAAADAFAELTEDRPGRPALDPDHAATLLTGHARSGRLDPQAVAAVVGAGGARSSTTTYPAGLTAREVEVLRLAARGLSNKEIGAALTLSPRTIGNHLARSYDKIDRHTRAGAALFVMEHGLHG